MLRPCNKYVLSKHIISIIKIKRVYYLQSVIENLKFTKAETCILLKLLLIEKVNN